MSRLKSPPPPVLSAALLLLRRTMSVPAGTDAQSGSVVNWYLPPPSFAMFDEKSLRIIPRMWSESCMTSSSTMSAVVPEFWYLLTTTLWARDGAHASTQMQKAARAVAALFIKAPFGYSVVRQAPQECPSMRGKEPQARNYKHCNTATLRLASEERGLYPRGPDKESRRRTVVGRFVGAF